MKNTVIFALIPIFLLSCKAKSTKSSPSIFKTTPPSLLFFKNTRSIYYELSEDKTTRIETYRLKQISKISDRAFLVPLILNNWIEDEAYLILEQNDYPNGYSAPLTIYWKREAQTDSSLLKTADYKSNYHLANTLYKQLQQGDQLFVLNQAGEEEPLFKRADDKSFFMQVVRDYLKLTDAL